MIPKKIHYCWFGGNPLSKLGKKCIKSWKKHCPDYEIIEWNENNFDISTAPQYVRQAYDAKKWAFVTDYVRLWAMTTYGGIYMDTDVEVIKPLDEFLKHEAFSGFEDEIHIPTGIMACEKGFSLFCELLKYYDDAEFINPDGSLNLCTNVIVITDMCTNKGFLPNNQYQVVEGFALYPNDFFCPVVFDTGKRKITKNTATIHWFSGSWLDEETIKRRKENQKNRKKYLRADLKHKILTTPNRIAVSLLGEKSYQKLKEFLKGNKE